MAPTVRADAFTHVSNRQKLAPVDPIFRLMRVRSRDDYYQAVVRLEFAPSHAAPRRLDADLAASLVLAAVGGLFALSADAAPTGWESADNIWRVAVGVLIVVCATQAPAPAWVFAAALAAASSSESLSLLVGLGTLVIAAFGAYRFATHHAFGAAAGVGVGFVVFRLPHTDFLGLSTVVAVAVVAPLVIGGWYWGPLVFARLLNWLLALLGVAVAGSVIAVLFASFDARSDINRSTAFADQAVRDFRNGNTQEAQDVMTEAVGALRSADDATSKWWLKFARAVPIVGQHVEVLQTVTGHGAETGDAALTVLADLDRDSLTIESGVINLHAVQALEPSVVALAEASLRAQNAFIEARSPWLSSLMSDALEDAVAELDQVTVSAQRAADAVQLAPVMLGAHGVRNHLVLLVTPAELRGSGGLIGNWALIEATDGALSLTDVGRSSDLVQALEESNFNLSEPAAYMARYGDFSVETEFHDITLSPHFPDVASVAAQLFGEVKGVDVDTVMLVDPEAVAALLELTGPVVVDGRAMTSANTRDFLLLGQYVEYENESQRLRGLEKLLAFTFAKLFTIDFPDPWDLDEVFADVVAEDRLVVAAIDPAEQVLLDGLGVGGAFPNVDGDLLAVVNQNAGNNKVDTFLKRRTSYRVELDPFTGELEATVTIELSNLLTDLELPSAVVAHNDQKYDRGTNVSLLTIYSPHTLVGATVDGEEVGFAAAPEFEIRAYSRVIEIPADSAVVVILSLTGALDLSESYSLDVAVQAAVSPDDIDVVVSVPPSVTIAGQLVNWRVSLVTAADQRFELPLAFTG